MAAAAFAKEDRSRLAQNFNFEVVHTLQIFSLAKQALVRFSRSLLRSRAITLPRVFFSVFVGVLHPIAEELNYRNHEKC